MLKLIYDITYHVSCQIWVKSVMKNLPMMQLNNYVCNSLLFD